jgi:hypothetical protein
MSPDFYFHWLLASCIYINKPRKKNTHKSKFNGRSQIFPQRQKHLPFFLFHMSEWTIEEEKAKFGRRGEGLIKKHELT